eukprot:1158955-Pelagomonas_calceolata.AAC.14
MIPVEGQLSYTTDDSFTSGSKSGQLSFSVDESSEAEADSTSQPLMVDACRWLRCTLHTECNCLHC